MMNVSEVKTKAPESFQSELQQKIYETLAHLDIPSAELKSLVTKGLPSRVTKR